MQARISLLEELKKKKKKGYSVGTYNQMSARHRIDYATLAKWTVTVKELAEAELTTAGLKARLDVLEVQETEVNGSASMDQSEQSSDRKNGGTCTARSKKGGSDQENGEEAAATSKKTDVQENADAAPTASEKCVGTPGLGDEHGTDGRTPASQNECDQMDNVDQEMDGPHLDVPEKSDSTPAPEKNYDQMDSTDQEIDGSHLDVVKKNDGGESKETGAQRTNLDKEIEEPEKNDNQESGETSERATEKNGETPERATEKNGDQQCEDRSGLGLTASNEPNTKKRKHDDGDEETAGAEGHMVGPGELGTRL